MSLLPLPWRRASALRSLTPILLLFTTLSLTAGTQTRPAPTTGAVPDEAMRRNNLGVALMDAGTRDPKYFAEAVREFEAAAALAPAYRTARLNLGLALYFAGQTPRAATLLQQFVSETPDSPQAHYVLGLVREYEGRFDAAATHFRRVVEHDGTDPDAWYHLGFSLGRAGRPREAIEPLRRAAALLPYQRRVRYALYMALSRGGLAAEAQAELERFRALDGSQIRVVEGPKNLLEYLKQGRYAEAIPDSRAVAPPPAPPSYADASRLLPRLAAAPLGSEVREILGGARRPRDFYGVPANRARVGAALRASAAITDVNGDGRLDLAFLGGGARRFGVLIQDARGAFAPAALPARVRLRLGEATAMAWGDLDNDGWSDLVIAGPGFVARSVNRKGRLGPPLAVAPAPPAGLVPAALSLADLDHDGDLDVAVAGGIRLGDATRADGLTLLDGFKAGANMVLRNNSDGTFSEIAAKAGLDGGGTATRAFTFTDVDEDRAVDAVLVDMAGSDRVFLNRKDGTFAAAPGPRTAAAVSAPLGEARAYGDLNGDGGVDVFVVRADAIELRFSARPPSHWLTVRAAGYAVPGKVKSNALGIGTRLEVRSAGRWERRDIRAGNGTGGADAPEVTFDLGRDARLDFVRAVFPSGVRRTLADVAAGQVLRIEEPLLDVNSCPTLFTWNGERFAFITDTLSAGILGELIAPGRYWQPDPDEWVRVEGSELVPTAAGGLEIRFTNPLEEVTYLDGVRLVAVDHPDSVEVYSDERMVGLLSNRRPVRLHALVGRRPLASAIDHHGHDVGDLLAARDRRFFDHFSPRPFKGFAGDWSLTLDLGPQPRGARPMLGLHGWSYWNSSAAVVAAAQAGERLRGPALDVRDASGGWRVATEDLGLPAGLPRPLVIDLAPFLRAGEQVVRIRSNRTIYYDEAWVAFSAGDAALDGQESAAPLLRQAEAPLQRSTLRWLGYPDRVLPDGRLPERFDYTRIRAHADWGTHAGLLTRYGDVSPLLTAVDDRMAVMGHGEEIALTFDGSRLRPPPPGWRRTWFFYGYGYEKGHEIYSAHADTVGPLPYGAMPGYPPPDGSQGPEDPQYLDYLLEWNTRPAFITGPATEN